MTSIIADVLLSTGNLEKENVKLKINDLKKSLDDKKMEVLEILKTIYVDFVPAFKELEGTESQILDLEKDYCDLNEHIEKEIKPQMINYVSEFKDVVEDLKKIKKLKSAAKSLAGLHESLTKAKNHLHNNLFLNSARELDLFTSTLKELDLEDEKEIKVLKAIKIEYMVTKEDLIYRTETMWRENICIYSLSEVKKKTHSIKFRNISEESGKELLFTLSLTKQLKPVLREFGKQFLTVICSAVLLKTVTAKKLPDESALNLTVIKEHFPEPSKAFKILLDIFDFINGQFFHLPVSPNLQTSTTALRELGIAIEEDFCTFVIEKCLKAAIPKQSNQLEAFHLEMEEAENFCLRLQELEFLPSPNKLLTFIHDVDDLPINKMAQNLLSQARTLMKTSFHKTIAVGFDTQPMLEEESMNSSDEMTKTQQGLSKFTFSFPKCQISESVIKLGDLFMVAKNEAKNIASPHAIRLYYTCRNIVDLFICVVPTYHKDEIENIPQQTAIFHNNCMYLSHYLGTLGPLFNAELQQVTNVTVPFVFVDLIPEVKKIGIEAFLAQMRKQKAQLLQLLQEQVAYASIMMDDGSVSKAEKAIRQCLCQLQLLKNVWSEVLPIEVYFKSIGTLFSSCLEEVILRISSMEDIAADVAASLDTIFTIFVKEGPELFKVGLIDKRNSVHMYVKKWFKFQEFQIILSASMKEIVDRWASGKGPLADHFTSEEVKHLIRALFQNTERRAAALAKIR